jgi:elongation factor Ts
MTVSTDQVKELRDQTGVSVIQCKKALEEAGGDHKKALVILRKKAGAVGEKKAGRMLGAGVVQCYVHNTNEVGAMVLLSCETDFVSKNEEFVSLAREIAMHIAASSPKYIHRDNIDVKEQDSARDVFVKEVADKPKDMQEKIIAGKLSAYFKDMTLLEQPYIKDQERTIQNLIDEAVQKFGERIEVSDFIRYSVR